MPVLTLTLFYLGGGGKKHRTTIHPSAVSEGQWLGSPKFLTLFLSIPDISQRSHFWNFFLKILENWTSKILGGPRALGEKLKNRKRIFFFFKKSYFFWLNYYCTCSQLSFEVYNTSVAQNLKFRPFLTWKIWFLTFVIWQLVAAKVYYIEGSFWCL